MFIENFGGIRVLTCRANAYQVAGHLAPVIITYHEER